MDKNLENQLDELLEILGKIRVSLCKKEGNKTITDAELIILNFIDSTSLAMGKMRDEINCLKPFKFYVDWR